VIRFNDQFYDSRRNLLFRITPHDLGLFVDAPESVKENPLFRMLVDDGSIKFPEDARSVRTLENDPMAGATADGKEIKETKPRNASKPKSSSGTKATASVKAKTKSDPDSEPGTEPAPQPASDLE